MSKGTLVHTTRIKLRWGDMDAFGHVNNTIYFQYMEQARVEWLGAVGKPMEEGSDGPVLLDAYCRFVQQLKYPADVDVLVYAGAPGRSSIPTSYEIVALADDSRAADVLVAEGSSKIVWIDFDTGKSISVPDFLRAHLPTDSSVL